MTDASGDQMTETRASVKFAFALEGWADETFLVSEWQGREALSQPYQIDALLASKRSDIAAEQMLGSRATFTLSTPGEKQRSFHGLITAAEQLDRTLPYTFYRVRLEPQLAVLAHYRYTEVYLGKTLPGLVTRVLKDCGFMPGDGGDFELRVHRGRYPGVNFVCQYEETCLDFLSRRLERGGMYYYFDQSGTREQVVFCDDKFFEPSFETAGATGWYRPQRDIHPDYPPVLSVSRRCEALPARVTVADYSGGQARRLRLQASHAIKDGGKGSWVVYGEHFNTDKIGRYLAQGRAEAIGAASPRISGRSEVSSLSAGYPLELRDHFHATLNTRYRVLEVHHEGRQTLPELVSQGEKEGYHNSFVAMPLDKPYRTPLRTPIPHVAGVISAIIDGEGDSQKAYIDEYGRYRVRLPVDHTPEPDARGSAWVRLATPYAGSQQGMHFPLLKGTEVLLAFINGDPDRPVIVNALTNSENPNVATQYNARENRVQTVNGNTLVMDDDPAQPTTSLTVPGAGYWKLGKCSSASETPTNDQGGQQADQQASSTPDWQSGGVSATTTGPAGFTCEWTAEYKVVLGASSSTYVGAVDSVYLGQYGALIAGLNNSVTLGLKTSIDVSACMAACLTLKHEFALDRTSQGMSLKRVVGQSEIKSITSKHDSVDFSVNAAKLGLEGADTTVKAGTLGIDAGEMEVTAVGLGIKATESASMDATTSVTISSMNVGIMSGDSASIVCPAGEIKLKGLRVAISSEATATINGQMIQLG